MAHERVPLALALFGEGGGGEVVFLEVFSSLSSLDWGYRYLATSWLNAFPFRRNLENLSPFFGFDKSELDNERAFIRMGIHMPL